jgi:hypothetical protein
MRYHGANKWPIHSDSGEFYMMLPSWIDSDGKSIDLPELEGILIRCTDVSWVEFVHSD